MSNFGFLCYFSPPASEDEKIYASAPAMCAVGCRKALEFADVVS